MIDNIIFQVCVKRKQAKEATQGVTGKNGQSTQSEHLPNFAAAGSISAFISCTVLKNVSLRVWKPPFKALKATSQKPKVQSAGKKNWSVKQAQGY